MIDTKRKMGKNWYQEGIRVVTSDQLDFDTAQTPGMTRSAAINRASVGAEKLWAGTGKIQPNAKTGAHHHGPLESVIYVIKGQARDRQGSWPRCGDARGRWDRAIPAAFYNSFYDGKAERIISCWC